ncbi:hypothetical protein GETHOR_07340 [Geothrix oryzae]|uniref:2-oxoacid dehydrogenase acyltransferase catalytic domain-containing protein n=1 Tax=Geothrix oryzae TaxID=2927975 RepID=A0ABN6UVJ8_9BACT|nr:2-oxo acid dehydrogenase subunit E2 [Geothrix oryzae]BDU68633.1 hypothetical protein GETHOR_07340 [Geothrix oryzae]
MPLFSRPDGDLIRGEAPVRRIMPYLMRGRNESCVYQESLYRIAAARVWLKAYNRVHHPRATLFHLVAYATAVALETRPRLNRFVSGGRLYQRRGVSISFVAKKAFTDEAPGATVKLAAFEGESFTAFSARISTQVEEARETDRAVDKEVALIMRLPGPVVRLLVGLARGLDHWNLYPGFMIRDDPMYASIFLANLGSVGVSDVFHHLYEYGTVSIFGAVSAPRRATFATRDGVSAEEALSVRWTFDERIDDAFSCARALVLVQKVLEDPGRWLGPPEGTPAWLGTEAEAQEP